MSSKKETQNVSGAKEKVSSVNLAENKLYRLQCVS